MATTAGDGTVPVETAAGASAATAGRPAARTEQASGGLPQFQFQHWGGQIAYLLVLFAILYALMARVFGPRIRHVFSERARVISEALTSAHAVRDEADAQSAAAKKALDAARGNATRTAADAKARATEEAKARQAALEATLERRLAEAEARIRASREQAMGSVSAVATEAAQAIVHKLTGLSASADETAAAVATAKG